MVTKQCPVSGDRGVAAGTHTSPVEQGLARLGRRYAGAARSAVVICVGVLAPFAAGEGRLAAATAGGVLAVVWSVVYTREMLRGPGRWVMPVDVTVVVVLCVTAYATVPPDALANGRSWVIAVASITVVAYQWHTRWLLGGAVTAAVAAAYVVGTWPATGPSFVVWTFAEATLSRGLFLMVREAGRTADREAVREAEARRESVVAAARRADERDQLAALHDTAATTLLMVGVGAVSGRREWLATQAARDLVVLVDPPPAGAGSGERIDLGAALQTTVEEAGRCILIDLPAMPILVLPRVAAAAGGAVREALSNVARHAPEATVHVCAREHDGGRVLVTVSDDGPGFDPTRRSRGRGIPGSIVERTVASGGSAAIDSLPGRGTVVRLQWCAPGTVTP